MKVDSRNLGALAKKFGGLSLSLTVLGSEAGFYLGTTTTDNRPFTRESNEYWRTDKEAQAALAAGDWTQRLTP